MSASLSAALINKVIVANQHVVVHFLLMILEILTVTGLLPVDLRRLILTKHTTLLVIVVIHRRMEHHHRRALVPLIYLQQV